MEYDVLPGQIDFNPPTPCGVGRACYYTDSYEDEFQSTHPVWGGTACGLKAYEINLISIHPPRVGWDVVAVACGLKSYISIHPPRVGWDHRLKLGFNNGSNFNPPTPCGVGRSMLSPPLCMSNFNPPTPCGVGPKP